MALGILEDSHLENVPGTTYVFDDDTRSTQSLSPDSRLKYDRSGPVPIILVPQPSDDPNDPLNWPLWKRDVILAILSFVAVLCTTASPLLAANTVEISVDYKRRFTDTALLTGYHLCGVGVAGLLIVPTARVWGKRHLFLLGDVLMIISSIWGGVTSKNNYKSLIWARVFQGIALAPFEALVNAAVGDLFFVHERGKRMAISNVALFGGAFLTPVFAGKISDSLGWNWTLYLLGIFSGAALPLLFFFVPETAFRRSDRLNTDFGIDTKQHHMPTEPMLAEAHRFDDPPSYEAISKDAIELGNRDSSASGPAEFSQRRNDVQDGVKGENLPAGDVVPKASFIQTLKLVNGRKTDENFFKLLLRPLPLFFHPGILWACLIQGVLIGWTVFIGVVLAAIFLGPPLWFDQVKTGYLYTGAFIGSILGLFLAGLLADWTTHVMIKWNKGKFEPEFRIILVVFQLIFSSIGLYGFGVVTDNVKRYGWLLTDVFFMFVTMGMVMGAVASALYIVDAHRRIAVEAFTCLLVFKNMFSFVLTYFAYDWVVLKKPKNVFFIIASIQIGVCLLSIPMYIFGKRNRSFFARHDILKKLNLW